jgi:hypothetical protein
MKSFGIASGSNRLRPAGKDTSQSLQAYYWVAYQPLYWEAYRYDFG